MTAKSRTYRADERDERVRIDTLLGELDSLPSRSAAARLLQEGRVLVNGVPVTKKYLVHAGDSIEYPMIEERPRISLSGENIPLDIRYEDDDLIVLSKQADLVCHPSVNHESGTLVNALIAHCGADHLGTLQGSDRPGIVHRLDKDTTGLMLAAKNDSTQAALQDAIRMRTVDRRYIALVHGYIAPDTGLIDAPIARGVRNRMRMEVSDRVGSRSCVTTFSVLERFEAGSGDQGYTLIECKLYTGRTHQIRVHMESIGHACVGDPLYGNTSSRSQLGLERQFLHSYSLVFAHPATGEEMRFIDGLPDDLSGVLYRIGPRAIGRTEIGDRVLPLVDGTRY